MRDMGKAGDGHQAPQRAAAAAMFLFFGVGSNATEQASDLINATSPSPQSLVSTTLLTR